MQTPNTYFIDDKNPPLTRWLAYVLGLQVLVWVVAHGISDTNLDSYADMLENFAWGQTVEWGSAKHPPLFAWITGAWFAVFPNLDVAYHLLSYTNAALGLLGVYRMAQALGRHDLALPAMLLLCMAFPYSTLAVKFNANAILLSLWPWVAAAWLHSVQRTGRQGWIWSAALGILSALAMLGKYYSGVFLLGVFLTALTTHQGRQWFSTFKPWFALGVFGLCLLPHLQWLHTHDWVTLHYISEQGGSEGVAWDQLAKFALAPLAYWLLPGLLCTWLYAPGAPSVAQRLWGWPVRLVQAWRPTGWDDGLFWLAMLPWMITLVFGISGFVELSLPWAIPIGYGFSLLWLRNLSAQRSAADTTATTRTLYNCVKVWFVIVLLVSPWYAWHQARQGTDNHYLPRREAAKALLQAWHERYPTQPLRWVGGQWAENALLAFYGDATLRVVAGVPDQFPATVSPLKNWSQQAGLLLCPLGPVDKPAPTTCAQDMKTWLEAQGQSTDAIALTVKSQGLRFPLDKPFAYLAFAYLPPAK